MAVGKRISLSWEQLDDIMAQAEARGLEHHELSLPERIGADETSFQKRHE